MGRHSALFLRAIRPGCEPAAEAKASLVRARGYVLARGASVTERRRNLLDAMLARLADGRPA